VSACFANTKPLIQNPSPTPKKNLFSKKSVRMINKEDTNKCLNELQENSKSQVPGGSCL
jgi:hypothetical protein